ncbi:unnamed protein product, partial [Effrenium voratum]
RLWLYAAPGAALWCPPCGGAAVRDGVALQHACRRKERRYPELQAAGPHRFVVLPGWWPVGLRGGRAREAVRPAPHPTRAACVARLSAGRMEAPLVGHPGRRATESADLRPAMPAAETGPPPADVLPRDGPLGPSGVAAAYARRWGQLLAVAAQGALAASLASLPPDPGAEPKLELQDSADAWAEGQMGLATRPPLCFAMMTLSLVCLQLECDLAVSHLAGVRNEDADVVRRMNCDTVPDALTSANFWQRFPDSCRIEMARVLVKRTQESCKRRGKALCRNVTLVPPGAGMATLTRGLYPELAGPGPQRLVVISGRFGSDALDLVGRLVHSALLRHCAALLPLRWWGLLGVALQRAVVSTLLCGASLSPVRPAADVGPDLGDVLGAGDVWEEPPPVACFPPAVSSSSPPSALP